LSPLESIQVTPKLLAVEKIKQEIFVMTPETSESAPITAPNLAATDTLAANPWLRFAIGISLALFLAVAYLWQIGQLTAPMPTISLIGIGLWTLAFGIAALVWGQGFIEKVMDILGTNFL
jgi:hypothetical protein